MAEELEKRALTLTFQNKQDDLMTAIEAMDLRGKEGTRKTIHIMAVLLVGYWSVQLVFQEPGFVWGWIMLLITALLGVFVLREPRAGNLKYTARYVERAPEGKIVVNETGFFLEDGTGRDPFRYADGLKVYEYQNVICLDGGKRRFAMIPLDQLDEGQRDELMEFIQKGGNYEKLEPKAKPGLFGRK